MSWNPFKRRPQPAAPAPEAKEGWFASTHMTGGPGFGGQMLAARDEAMRKALPRVPGVAMDDASNGMPAFKGAHNAVLPDALTGWFSAQGFIGYQTCAMVAQNWLVDKVLTMPARDAIRHGYDVHVTGLAEGEQQDEQHGIIVERLEELSTQMRVRQNMEQLVKMGRLFGIRVMLFRVEGIDYEAPFNIDGVQPGAYKGMSQVDPYWCIPELSDISVLDPTNPHFYEPTWWVIQGRRYHRSHLCIFRPNEVPDVLKPLYQYGGVPVPQRILERVYAAERTANEGPQLAMTKRLNVWKTDLEALIANQAKAAEWMGIFSQYRDNFGTKLVDVDDTIEVHDTTLADLDATIMTQYQLVAAAGGVPATKLLGTTPKGFNSTGEYDESSYHEELETIQANDLTPMLARHYELLMRSEIEPEQGAKPGTLGVKIDWAPVDSPTALEYATINKTKAETDSILATIGSIDAMDVRNRIKMDRNSDYTGIADPAEDGEGVEDIIQEILGNDPTQSLDPELETGAVGGDPERRDL